MICAIITIFALMNFITIKTARNATEFLVLKSKLESEGIRCQIKNGLSSQVLNYLPMMEAELQIAEDDLVLYRELIADSEVANPADKKIVCPKCGSENVRVKYSAKNLWKALGIILLSVFSVSTPAEMFKGAKLKCRHCYHVFSEEEIK